jgi:hypothetical protein
VKICAKLTTEYIVIVSVARRFCNLNYPETRLQADTKSKMANSTISTYKWEKLNDYTLKKLKCIAGTLFYFTIEEDSVNLVLCLLCFQKQELNLFLCSNAIINHMNLQFDKKLQ